MLGGNCIQAQLASPTYLYTFAHSKEWQHEWQGVVPTSHVLNVCHSVTSDGLKGCETGRWFTRRNEFTSGVELTPLLQPSSPSCGMKTSSFPVLSMRKGMIRRALMTNLLSIDQVLWCSPQDPLAAWMDHTPLCQAICCQTVLLGPVSSPRLGAAQQAPHLEKPAGRMHQALLST